MKVIYHGLPSPIDMGKLACKDGLSYFQFNPSFLALNINVSPFHLKLTDEVQVANAGPFEGLHGVFADSLPDGWGLLLMDRYFRENGIEVSTVSPIDRLAYISDKAMGALSYEPGLGVKKHDELVSIDLLASESLKVYNGTVDHVISELAIAGGSPCGARPKVVVGLCDKGNAMTGANLPDGFEHWLVKFPSGASEVDRAEGSIEYAYSLMAKDAGINFPETKLITTKDNRYFACKRFDRADNQRVHMHTFAGLVGTNFRVPDSDYQLLMKAAHQLVTVETKADTRELLLRMIFNVLSGNKDDHTKNFSFIIKNGQWRLSPNYDITFNKGISGQHSMAISGQGKDISFKAIATVADLASIPKKEVAEMLLNISDSLSQWGQLAKDLDVPKGSIKEIEQYIGCAIRCAQPARVEHQGFRP